MGRSIQTKPLYILKHGIKVFGEYAGGRYVMVRAGTHKLFPNSKSDQYSRIYIQRARVVMTAKLGRILKSSEHVHHKNEKQKHNDRLSNLELLPGKKHGRLHKLGSHHTAKTKKCIGASLREAYEIGVRPKPNLNGPKNPFFGRCHTIKSKKQMRKSKRTK